MGWSRNSLKGAYIGDEGLGFRLQGLNFLKGFNLGVTKADIRCLDYGSYGFLKKNSLYFCECSTRSSKNRV